MTPKISHPKSLSGWRHVAWASAWCVLTTLTLMLLPDWLDRANVVMVYLGVVLVIAARLDRRSAIVAAVLSVVLFDFVFVPPRYSLTVQDSQYVLTFAIMLAVALMTARMASGLRQAAHEAQTREARTHALYALAQALSGAATRDQAVAELRQQALAHTDSDTWIIWVPGGQGSVVDPGGTAPVRVETHLATMALTQGHTVTQQAMDEPGYASTYIPLKSADTVWGVLAVAWRGAGGSVHRQQIDWLEAAASLLVIALQRQHYVEMAHHSQMSASADRLRSSILSALSHDVRTPLTVLSGLAETLLHQRPALPDTALDTARAIATQARQLSRLVTQLLEMARLQSGGVTLHLEWHDWRELIEASVRFLGDALAHHVVRVSVPEDTPLVRMDAVLMERVVSNLLENAVKFSAPGSLITLSVAAQDHGAVLTVMDEGSGFDAASGQDWTALFARGRHTGHSAGFGLGLAICRAIVQVHRGHLTWRNRPQGGAVVEVCLPQDTPPRVVEDSA